MDKVAMYKEQILEKAAGLSREERKETKTKGKEALKQYRSEFNAAHPHTTAKAYGMLGAGMAAGAGIGAAVAKAKGHDVPLSALSGSQYGMFAGALGVGMKYNPKIRRFNEEYVDKNYSDLSDKQKKGLRGRIAPGYGKAGFVRAERQRVKSSKEAFELIDELCKEAFEQE